MMTVTAFLLGLFLGAVGLATWKILSDDLRRRRREFPSLQEYRRVKVGDHIPAGSMVYRDSDGLYRASPSDPELEGRHAE